MKKALALILAVLMAVSAMVFVSSCSKEKGKLIVGVTDYPPYDYEEVVGSGNWIGFDADMARLLGEKLGVKVEFIEIDWDQKITELKTGKIDLIWNGMTMDDDLAKEMDFSKPYAKNSQVAVVKKSNASKYTSIESINGVSIVVEGGSAGEKAAKETFKDSKVLDLSNQAKALFEVNAGTSEVAMVDYSMAKSLCGTGDYADLVMVEAVNIGEEQFAVGARKGSAIVAEINALFDETFKNGKMTELQQKYGANEDGSNSIALCEF